MYRSMTDPRGTGGGVPRRRWLAVSGTVLAGAFAGCLGGDSDSDDGDNQSDGGPDSQPGANDDPDTDNPDTDNSDTDNPDTDDEPLPATLTGLTVGDATDTVPNLVASTDAPLTVTLDSETEITRPGTLVVDILAVEETAPWTGDSPRPPPEGTPVATVREAFNVQAATSQSLTFEGLTDDLAGGPYVVVARVPEAETHAVAPLTVTATTEINAEVYTQTTAPENRPTAGELVLSTGPVPTAATDDSEGDDTEGSTVLAVVDLAEGATPTLSVPLGVDADTVVVTARNVDGGVYPPASAEVPLEGTDLPDVELVAGYEFQGTDAMRFTDYILWRNDPYSVPRFEEWIMYGTYGANGDYNCHYTRGSQREANRLIDSDGTPPEYGADLGRIQSEQRLAPPEHSVTLDGKGFYYPDNRWEASDKYGTAYRRSTHIPVLGSLDAVTEPTPGERKYVGTEQYRNRGVDIYRINTNVAEFTLPDSRVFVDPETGYILRIEQNPMAEDGQGKESFEVAEFFDHGEPATADVELLKNRSKPKTHSNLDELPWERASKKN
jgi:hypothetical protein